MTRESECQLNVSTPHASKARLSLINPIIYQYDSILLPDGTLLDCDAGRTVSREELYWEKEVREDQQCGPVYGKWYGPGWKFGYE